MALLSMGIRILPALRMAEMWTLVLTRSIPQLPGCAVLPLRICSDKVCPSASTSLVARVIFLLTVHQPQKEVGLVASAPRSSAHEVGLPY